MLNELDKCHFFVLSLEERAAKSSREINLKPNVKRAIKAHFLNQAASLPSNSVQLHRTQMCLKVL